MTLTAHRSATRLPSDLPAVARHLVAGGRGLLAADESVATMSARMAAHGIEATAASRRDYRAMLLAAPGLSSHVAGVIWCEETHAQSLPDGEPLPAAARRLGILPGIKVDTGTSRLPGSTALVTEGLDGLGPRLERFAADGAAFAKWRAVLDVASLTPYVARVNADALARYAALCQAHGIVPVVEPEVLAAGDHDLVACARASRLALDEVFAALDAAGVDPAAIVLKPSFVTPGLGAGTVSASTVATVTHDVLRDAVPPAVPGIAFLSGGHRAQDACDYLAALNRRAAMPWAVTFSFGRALVSDALATWGGRRANLTRAQEVLLDRCARAHAAASAR